MATRKRKPLVIVLGGPNGAGKSTTALDVLQKFDRVIEFVNADTIARGLSALNSESVALQAGRLMLIRLRELATGRNDFAFESTLSSRSFAPWLKSLIEEGYEVRVYYSWLKSSDISMQRVADRVLKGGHHIPEANIRRRHARSAHNFINLYLPLASVWRVVDNSESNSPVLVAEGRYDKYRKVYDDPTWQAFIEISKNITSRDVG